jgi:predicted transcriptional regulator
MPLLLQELVEESSKSNRWAAERLDAEAKQFDELPQTEAALQKLNHAAVAFITVAIDFAIARAEQADGFWKSGLALLRKEPTDDSAVSFFQTLLSSFESCLSVIHAVHRERPKLAAALRTEPELPKRLEELDRAERRLLELASDAKNALQHQIAARQPSDPDRLAKGLQLAREGKVVSADEARARYSRAQGLRF